MLLLLRWRRHDVAISGAAYSNAASVSNDAHAPNFISSRTAIPYCNSSLWPNDVDSWEQYGYVYINEILHYYAVDHTVYFVILCTRVNRRPNDVTTDFCTYLNGPGQWCPSPQQSIIISLVLQGPRDAACELWPERPKCEAESRKRWWKRARRKRQQAVHRAPLAMYYGVSVCWAM